jgi:hypothetical protein
MALRKETEAAIDWIIAEFGGNRGAMLALAEAILDEAKAWTAEQDRDTLQRLTAGQFTPEEVELVRRTQARAAEPIVMHAVQPATPKPDAAAAVNAYYSLIQYCPDAGRDERVNVGVVLSLPDRLWVQAVHNFARVARIFPDVNKAWLSSTFCSVIDQLMNMTPAALPLFIATRANQITMTPLRPCKADNPIFDLASLFAELVAEPKPAENPPA